VHYVEREVQRWLSARATPVALPITEEPKIETPAAAAARAAGGRARPLAGPAVPLAAERASESEELLGAKPGQQATDAMVTKVLVRGEPVPTPAGRADDFTWPRRGVAPVGSDPVVATTDLPMTPMLADRGPGGASTTAAAQSTEVASAGGDKPAARAAPRRVQKPPSYADAQSVYRPDYRPNYQQRQFQPFGFGNLFGGRW